MKQPHPASLLSRSPEHKRSAASRLPVAHSIWRVTCAGCLCLFALSVAALACGPSRQKTVETIEIAASVDAIWNVVGTYADMSWHPAILRSESHPQTMPAGELGQRRTLHYRAGPTMTDTLEKRDATHHTLAFLTEKVDQTILPVTGYASTIIVREVGNRAQVEWRGAFSRGYQNANPPPELDDEAAMRAVVAFQHAGLVTLKALLEQPLERADSKPQSQHAGTSCNVERGAQTNPGSVANSSCATVSTAQADQAPPPLTSAREAVVTTQLGDSLSIVDLATRKMVAEIAIGGKPAGIALSPDGTFAYLAAPESREVVVVDVQSRSIARRFVVGDGPLGVAVNPITGELYVADLYRKRLLALNSVTGAILKEVAVGDWPSGIAVSLDGKLIATSDRNSNAVSLINADTFERSASIPVGQHPFGLTMDAHAQFAYSANVESHDVSVIDLAQRRVVATVAVGVRPYAVAIINGRAFVTNQHGSSVSVIDLATRAVIKTIQVGGFPEGIEADSAAGLIYVACWDADTLEVIDVATLEVVGQIPVGRGPRAFGQFLR